MSFNTNTATTTATVIDGKAGGFEDTTTAMIAVTQRRYGSSEQTTIERVGRPDIASDQVLIEVVAAGLDRGVIHLMTGLPYVIRLMGYGFRRPKQPVLGMDVAGRVVEIGSAVTRFSVGDEVMGIASGSFAEYAAADEAKLVPKPAGLECDAAAVSTISGITALQALTTEGNLQPGERVAVIGSAGGVGTFAVQIAAGMGAVVTGVARTDQLDFVRSLGAAEMVDYTTTDLGELEPDQFDLIIDIGGRNPLSKLRRILTATGRLVIVGGEDGGRFTGGIGRQLRATLLSLFVNQDLSFFISEEGLRYLGPLADLLASETVVPAIGDRYELAEARAAIRGLETGRTTAKTAIIVRPIQDL